jgi:hypothetical protein
VQPPLSEIEVVCDDVVILTGRVVASAQWPK